MKQYIDKSAVIAKIRSLQYSTVDEEGNFYTAKAQTEYDILCMLEFFIGTLEVKEEPVSNDLEEAAMQYGTNEFSSLCNGCKHIPIDAFKVGAQWQKKQMIEKACEWLQNHNNYLRVHDNRRSVRFDMTQCVIDFSKAMEG